MLRAAAEAGQDIAASARAFWGETPFYQLQLSGPAPDRILTRPKDLRRAAAADGAAIAEGRIEIAGRTVKAGSPADIWDAADGASDDVFSGLHSFTWLRSLAAHGDREAARAAIGAWLDRYGKWDADGWAPALTAERLFAWLAHSRFVCDGADLIWRSRFLTAIGRQTRHLSRSAHRAPEGYDRLVSASGLAIAAAAMPNGEAMLERGLALLRREIRLQIRPDGGHLSRNPSIQLDALLRLAGLAETLAARNLSTPGFLRHALDKMTPMARYFQMGDGGLTLFHNGLTDDADALAAILARDDMHAKPFGFAPYTAYQRAAAGRSTVIMDVGRPAPPPFDGQAHESPLAFEFCHGRTRIVTNCGAAHQLGESWAQALRGVAAHSTICPHHTAAEASTAFEMESQRFESQEGLWLEALRKGGPGAPDARFQRRVFLSANGDDLRGSDAIWREGGGAAPGADIRFHIHPDVRASLSRDRKSVLLIVSGGEGWRFRSDCADVSLEKSVHIPDGVRTRAAEQIVLKLTEGVQSQRRSVKWAFKRMSRGVGTG